MQEYRFRESGRMLYVTWDGAYWIVSRMGSVKNLRVGTGGSYETREEAVSEMIVLYKKIMDLDIGPGL